MGKRGRPPDEMVELLAMIDTGRFMLVQAWIAAGKPLHRPGDRFSTCPLYRAVRSGGHDMVELLLQAIQWPPESLNHAVRLAAEGNQGDIAGLLFAAGASVAAVRLSDVCSGDGRLMEVCARAGVDLAKHDAFADSLWTGAKPPLGALINLRKDFPCLERQAAIALCRAVSQGHPGVVAKLIWAKADPCLVVNCDGSEVSAAQTACIVPAPDAFVALRLKPSPAQCLELMDQLCAQPCAGIMAELLKFISAEQLNSGPGGSCVALHRMLAIRRSWPDPMRESFRDEEFVAKIHVETRGSILLLIGHGAHWNPTPALFQQVSRAFALHFPSYVEVIVRQLSWSASSHDESAAVMLRREKWSRDASVNTINPYRGIRRRRRSVRNPKTTGEGDAVYGPPCPPKPVPCYYYGNRPGGPRRNLTRKRKSSPGWTTEPGPSVILRKRNKPTDPGMPPTGPSGAPTNS